MNGKITDAAKGANEEPTVLTHPYKFSAGSGWVGISHCAVFDDGAGNWYYVSQQRMPANVAGIAASNAIMMGGVRSIQWDSNGWPVVMPESVMELYHRRKSPLANWREPGKVSNSLMSMASRRPARPSSSAAMA